HPLTYDYYPKQIPIINWADFRAFLPFILYLAMGIYAVWGTIKKKDIYSYSIWFFLIPLSVVSNLFFPVGTFMNERFIFISSIGFCILLAWLLVEKLPILSEKIKLKPKSIALPVFFIILILYSGKTFTRNEAWKDDLTLFTTDVKVSYNSAKSTCSAGGKIIEYAQQPEIKADSILHRDYCLQAIQYLERSLEIYPEYADAQNLIGNAWYELELNSVKAILAYAEVLKHRPYHGVALNNVKIIINNAFNLLSSGNSVNTPQEILDALLILDSVKPGLLELYHLVGTIYGRYLNDLNMSVMYLEKSAELNNPNHLLYLDMGVAYGMSGNLQKALESFERAVELNPNDAQAWINLGMTYQHMGNTQKASEFIVKGNQLMGK
ncbi:MAG: tetratricopeptide repeat protein, partial [Bacteroidales bacterium]|nr:tetratricopeptide repeat protein [Bacteroidales bacterium]